MKSFSSRHSPCYPLVFPILLCLALSFPGDVSGTGAYMTAYLRRQNHKETSSLENKELLLNANLIEQKISFQERLDSVRLKSNDKLYSNCEGIDIRELTILQAQELFDANILTSYQLTSCYLRRIHYMDSILKSVLEINTNAINEAYKADVERRSGIRRGPLHGIPVLIKDSIDTRDFMQTTAGSWALFGLRPKKDAAVLKALKKAGAVIIGKANLSEFSAFRGAPNGWSGRGGQTKNTYNLLADPLGSSTGSAVAVAANLAMVSLGAETDGSLISPASVGGICTLKPTLNTVSSQGVIPISSNQDCVGPMARSMLDLAILFDGMLPQTIKDERACGGSFMQCLGKETYFKKFRVGIMRYPFWDPKVVQSSVWEEQLPQLERLLKILRSSSHFEIEDPVDAAADLLRQVSGEKEFIMLLHDFKHELNLYLKKQVETNIAFPEGQGHSYNEINPFIRKISSLRDIIQFNNDFPDGFPQEILLMAEETDGIFNTTYMEARDSNKWAARELLHSAMQKYNLDALMFPNLFAFDGSLPAMTDESIQDAPVSGHHYAAISGFPSMNVKKKSNVPAGINERGLPFGVTFIGTPNTEATLLQIGSLVERLNPARRPPQFLI